MKRLIQFLLLLAITGCAHLGLAGSGAEARADLWSQAQAALADGEYERAEATFEQLATSYPNSVEGRESLFYLGAIRLDPRNSAWDSGPAEEWLSQYLSLSGEDGPRLYRYPEAEALREIARQLNLPPESRVAGLQPEQSPAVENDHDRVMAPATEARDLAVQIQRLQAQIAERDAQIREQQAELERIRRTLTGSQEE